MKVIGTDTICTVSIATIRTYNNAIADLDACNLMADTLYAQKERYKSVNKDLRTYASLSDSLVNNYNGQVAEKNITELSYKKEAKKNKIKGQFFKGFAIGFGIVAIFEAGFIYLSKQ